MRDNSGSRYFGLRPQGTRHASRRDVPSVHISLQLIIIVSFFSVVCAFPEGCFHNYVRPLFEHIRSPLSLSIAVKCTLTDTTHCSSTDTALLISSSVLVTLFEWSKNLDWCMLQTRIFCKLHYAFDVRNQTLSI